MNRIPFVALLVVGCGGPDGPATGGLLPASSNGGGNSTITIGRADAGTSPGASTAGSTADAGASADQTTSGQGREYGVGEYAVILTAAAEPPRICWYTTVTTRICDGSPPTRRTWTDDRCVEGGQNCLGNEPADQEMDTGSCWNRIDHETVGRGPLVGDCARLAAYQRDYLAGACMFHKHCPGGKCIDYKCAGANYHLPGAPGGGPGSSPDAGTMLPEPMPGSSGPDAMPSGTSSPDASPLRPDATPTPVPPEASPPTPPTPPPGPPGGGPGGPAPPMP